jgi:hypothetical protein
VGTVPTDFIINLSEPADPVTVQGSDFTVNGSPANTTVVSNGNATIIFHFNTSPAVQSQNTMHIPAGAFDCGNGEVQEFTCTFFYEVPRPTPTPRLHPTPARRPSFVYGKGRALLYLVNCLDAFDVLRVKDVYPRKRRQSERTS